MRKGFMVLLLFFSVFFITACDIDSIINYSNQDETNGRCPGGWVEDGKCCKAEYTGVNVDADGNCPGASLPGNQVHHSTNNNSCYYVSCG